MSAPSLGVKRAASIPDEIFAVPGVLTEALSRSISCLRADAGGAAHLAQPGGGLQRDGRAPAGCGAGEGGVAAEVLSRLTGRPPRIPLTGVRMARKVMFFDAGKAIRELGFPQTPVEAVDWFTAHGFAGR